MELLNEDEIVSIEIDLEELKKNELSESFLAMFGTAIKMILDRMFSPKSALLTKYTISGKRDEMTSLARTLGREKKYLQAAQKHGLDNERTFKDKKKLEKKV